MAFVEQDVPERFKELLQKLREPRPVLKGGLLILALGALLEYIFGLYLFQRFGAILVMYSIGLLAMNQWLFSFGSVIERAVPALEKLSALTKEQRAVFYIEELGRNSKDIEELDKFLMASESLTHNADKSISQARVALLKCEVILGLVGTAVWGFGDLLSDLLVWTSKSVF